MDQLKNLADERLIYGCIYCGKEAETRDHVPSKVILDQPYPENLPVVGCCEKCNKSFSRDEQYLACLLEAVLVGSTDPEKIKNARVARTFIHSPALRSRIEASKSIIDNQVVFAPEASRVKNVMLKLARGHAAFELSQICMQEPDHYWCGALCSLSAEQIDAFGLPHIQEIFGEIGSRNIQRMHVAEIELLSQQGERETLGVLINDWIDVQENRYRYLSIDDSHGVIIRIVVSEYLACEIGWFK